MPSTHVITGLDRTHLTRAIEQAAEAIVITDEKGIILYVNPAFTAMTGYGATEAVGESTRLLRSGLQDARYYEELWQTVMGGGVWRGELINRRKDGTHYTEEMTIAPVRDGDGRTVSFIAIKQDVTKRRAAEAAQRLLASIVECTEDAIVGTTLDGVVQTWNRAAGELFGYTAEEVVGEHAEHFTPVESVEELRELIARLQRGEGVRQLEMRGLRKDGTQLDVSVSASPIRSTSGEVLGLAAILRDVSEKKRTERALRASEERYRALFENMQEGVAHCRMFFVDGEPRDFEYLMVNRAFARLTGLYEVCGKRVSALVPEVAERNGELLLAYGRVVRSGKPEKLEVYLTGFGKWFSVSAYCAGNEEFVAVFDDITERKAAQAAAEERVHMASLGATVGMALTTSESLREGLQRCTEAFVEHMGAAFARIWVLHEKTDVLELEASAGMYTHLDGRHARIPMGQYKIGWIAQCKTPHLSNDVVNDGRIGDREWARGEGLVGFAGYPLIVDGR
ncbi:MAG: PAS domain S-box protein, partial [Bryobacterales bacterium]|nr:PAS domain S-box protein [Bryobacterales bacterium]